MKLIEIRNALRFNRIVPRTITLDGTTHFLAHHGLVLGTLCNAVRFHSGNEVPNGVRATRRPDDPPAPPSPYGMHPQTKVTCARCRRSYKRLLSAERIVRNGDAAAIRALMEGER